MRPPTPPDRHVPPPLPARTRARRAQLPRREHAALAMSLALEVLRDPAASVEKREAACAVLEEAARRLQQPKPPRRSGKGRALDVQPEKGGVRRTTLVPALPSRAEAVAAGARLRAALAGQDIDLGRHAGRPGVR